MQTETNLAKNSTQGGFWYPHIQLLRAFAALSVVIYHIIEKLPWEGFPKTAPLLWFRVGWMGVDLFFVISGFVIMLSALMLYEKNPGTARKYFLIRRALRIVPLYMVSALVYLCVDPSIIHAEDFGKHVLTHLLFIHNWFVSTHGTINGPNWSVAAEFQFYILIWALMPYLVRMRPLNMLCLLIVAAWVCRAVAFGLAEQHDWPSFTRFIYATQMPSMLDLFGLGMVLAKWMHRRPAVIANGVSAKQAALLLGAFLVSAFFSNHTYWRHAGDYWDVGAMVIFWRSSIGVTFSLLIALFVLAPAAWLQKNPIYMAANYLGEISYGIYLWHFPVILFLKQYAWTHSLYFVACVLALTLGLSALSWHLLEKPCMGFAKRATRA